MLKIILTLLLTSITLFANAEFDALDQMSEPVQNQLEVERDLKTFEASLEERMDIDDIQPAAGFEELDNSFADEESQ